MIFPTRLLAVFLRMSELLAAADPAGGGSRLKKPESNSPKKDDCLNRWMVARGRLDGGAIMRKEIEAEAALEKCRALIDQINAGLSAEELFVDVLSSAELLLYLDFAASALKKAAPLSRERGETKVVLNCQWH
jgi:hypothetical protein